MPKRSTNRIIKSRVDALVAGQTIWDAEVAGFGVTANTHSKTYKLKYRHNGRQRMLTLGTHGTITPDEARKLAMNAKAEVNRGNDPAALKQEVSLTVEELARQYMLRHADVNKKPGSALMDRANIKNHVVPLLGKLPVSKITTTDIENFKASVQAGKTAPENAMAVRKAQKGGAVVRGGKGVANRCLALLSTMFNLAELWGLRTKQTNPVSGVKKFKEQSKERFLSDEEVQRVWAVLDELESKGENGMQYPVALFRLLMLTGARLNEIRSLQWSMVNLAEKRLDLPDSKTGKKVIHLPDRAVEVLQSLPRVSGNPYVIVGGVTGAPLVNAQKPWRRVRNQANLPDVRIHDLRHSFASMAVRNGVDLYTLGKTLGHKNPSTTQRYAHLSDEHMKKAAAKMDDAFGRAVALSRAEKK